jgi:sugar lactone lactonase YvrE
MKFMNKPFTTLIIVSLGTILFSTSAHAARNLAFDDKGNLFVADRNSGSILKFTSDGKRSTFASDLVPDHLGFDRSGNLFVWDGNAILKFTPDGKKSTFASGLAPEAWDLVFDRSGNLFVTDHVNPSILKFTPEGKKSTFASGLAPEHLAFDRSGNLFVTDKDSESILKFTSDGKRSTLASELGHPGNLTSDDNGNLFVSVLVKEYSSYSILKFTPEGLKSTFATGLSRPVDTAFGRSGNLFVTDDRRDSILKFTPDGKKSTFATGISSYGMAVDAAGNLFVSEYGGDLIFKFTPDGTPSTLVSDRVSPDKQWEYHCDAEKPIIVKAPTSQTVFYLSEEMSEAGNAKILWAPDSKRFGFNYSPLHAHHTTYEKVAFYQLRGDKWETLHSPADASQPSQLLQPPLKDHLPKGFNPRHCAPEWDELKLRTWTDANTAILYAPCYGRSRDLKAAFLFTLKFDDAGNWKIIKTHQMSKKELEESNETVFQVCPCRRVDDRLRFFYPWR